MTLPEGSRPQWTCGAQPLGNRLPDLEHEPSQNGTVSFSDLAAWSRR